jgi:hypothetical protein
MVIGIDISQIVYQGTGVSNFVQQLVRQVINQSQHQFILFASSFSLRETIQDYYNSLGEAKQRVRLVLLPIPVRVLEFLWNTAGILPIEWLIGKVDVFWSSDWVQPPLLHAKGVTTIHDLTPFRYPETFAENIVTVHKRKVERSKQVCQAFFCDSEATKKDARELLGIAEEKLFVVYAGRNS